MSVEDASLLSSLMGLLSPLVGSAYRLHDGGCLVGLHMSAYLEQYDSFPQGGVLLQQLSEAAGLLPRQHILHSKASPYASL